MFDNEHELECRIHRLEDKLLRSNNYNEQMNIQQVLVSLHMNLQRLRWGNNKVRA